MTEYCTIFGQHRDYAGVLNRVRQTSSAPVGVIGEENRWKKLVLKGERATLTLNSMEHDEPGDDFSKLVLSTHNFFRTADIETPNKEAVLKAVSSCSIAIGVVAEPALDEAEGHVACILDIARILDGMIFNGSAMLDSSGEPLLGQT